MKYLILVTDGAADEKIESLGNKTALEAANMPLVNELARKGEVGLVKTIPKGISPGSDAANLAVMGYDPSKYLTGRSPLEAVSIGIDMADTDVAFRTNFVTLVPADAENCDCGGDCTCKFEELVMNDHSAGDISTEEADELIQAINREFANEKIKFYTGTAYRHCLIIKNGRTDYDLTPPHDILDRGILEYLPGQASKQTSDKEFPASFIKEMMRRSYDILKNHPINLERSKKGLKPANSIWIWGQGKKPSLPLFKDKYSLEGAVISAVDLIKGIGTCAGLEVIEVPGASGTKDTNYTGKANAAIEAFKSGKDFVFLHVEGPDECSHQGDVKGKVLSLERIDKYILKPIYDYLRSEDEGFSILVAPDHWTPISIRTHTSSPVPYVLYKSTKESEEKPENSYTEDSASKGKYHPGGSELADYFFG
ncbi:MAG: cofactor-independent phosphoglycerate mutase [Anaerovoracaceae bacterium]